MNDNKSDGGGYIVFAIVLIGLIVIVRLCLVGA